MSENGFSNPERGRTGEGFWKLLGLCLVLAFWQLGSMVLPPLVLASPLAAFKALFLLLADPGFWVNHFLVTLGRVMAGVGLGALAGFGLGIAAGLNKGIRAMLEPLRWILMSVPAVVVVVIAMLWFGMGSVMVVFIAGLFLCPLVYVNIVKGMAALDEKYLEMAEVHGFPLLMRIKDIYIPAICAPLISALAIVVGNGVRVTILAEVLGSDLGLGYCLSSARTALMIPELFACVLLCLLIVGGLEFAFLKPLEKRLLQWKQ
ncbi:ABC transporter permease [Dethiosulfatarculus sandiegensis]|uniref:ABC transmembrane type-1 domain-containing protein n=1 Tax=Dethiosulfatarculus sandiegensis TaxID=1429043 RepID=A0A0D2JYV9_9BACT|nr:ABC transporter permease subunit [Dethiosulfatarculus sandiegensis]KIX14745.1 hypothetical protein X474_06280 [Dethiosulfatarculus sandiegensis]